MSERPPQLPPPTNPALLPVLAAVVYVAAVVALWGVLSLLLDREVVDYPDAGPLLGPAMATAAGLVTWLTLLRTRRSRSPWPGTIAAVLLAAIAMFVVAAVGYGPVAVPHFVISPFLWGAAVLSGVTVLGTWAIHPRRR
jgi:hypothetical protein